LSYEPNNPIASSLLIEATPAAGITTSPAADFPFWGTRSWHPQRELGLGRACRIPSWINGWYHDFYWRIKPASKAESRRYQGLTYPVFPCVKEPSLLRSGFRMLKDVWTAVLL
jgi:hypothetical protein